MMNKKVLLLWQGLLFNRRLNIGSPERAFFLKFLRARLGQRKATKDDFFEAVSHNVLDDLDNLDNDTLGHIQLVYWYFSEKIQRRKTKDSHLWIAFSRKCVDFFSEEPRYDSGTSRFNSTYSMQETSQRTNKKLECFEMKATEAATAVFGVSPGIGPL